jgi:hypothetical protein
MKDSHVPEGGVFLLCGGFHYAIIGSDLTQGASFMKKGLIMEDGALPGIFDW